MKKNRLVWLMAGAALAYSFPLAAHAAAGPNPAVAKKIEAYVQSNHLMCLSCHAVDHKVVGPAWFAVAQKYQHDPKAEAELTERIAKGGVGTWGNMPMPPNMATEAQAKVLATMVLDLAK